MRPPANEYARVADLTAFHVQLRGGAAAIRRNGVL
jgi:hypothetical protein